MKNPALCTGISFKADTGLSPSKTIINEEVMDTAQSINVIFVCLHPFIAHEHTILHGIANSCGILADIAVNKSGKKMWRYRELRSHLADSASRENAGTRLTSDLSLPEELLVVMLTLLLDRDSEKKRQT
jgi:hypothetical protein